MKPQFKGFLLGLSATAFWGSFYPVSRFMLGDNSPELDPLALTFLRFIFAGIFLLPFVIRRGNGHKLQSCLKNDWKMLLFLALTGIVGEGILVFAASLYTTAGRCTLLANASPIFTVLLAFLCLHELLNSRKIIGMLSGFAGIALIIFSRGSSDMFGTSTLAIRGDLMALGSGICWSIYTVFGQKISQRYGGIFCTALLFGIGVLLMIPILLLTGSSWNFNFNWKIWLGIAYIGGLTNGIANALWYQALNYLPPGKLGAFGYLSAFIAITLSALFLHEEIGWPFLLAAVMVAGGIFLMMKNPEHRCRRHPQS